MLRAAAGRHLVRFESAAGCATLRGMFDAPPLPPAPPAEEIVITGTQLAPGAGEAAFSREALSYDALAAPLRADQIVRLVPGAVSFRRLDSAAANPTVQGVTLRPIAPSGAGRALVTLDGAPLNDPFGGWVNWIAAPPEALAGAVIVRGAGAGPYGAGALTGVVALDSRAPEDGLEASAAAGGRDSVRSAAWAGRAGEDGGVTATLYGEATDGFYPVRGPRRGAADRKLYLDALSATVRGVREIGAAQGEARLTAYDEVRGSGAAGAKARTSGIFVSTGLSREAASGRPGYRARLWLHDTNLRNRFVAVSDDRETASPANDQYETPALGWGANAALRLNAAGWELEGGADARFAEGETRERFFFIGPEPQRERRAGGETAIAGLYGEASRRDGPWLMTLGARADAWRNTGGFYREFDRNSGALLEERLPEDNDGVTPTARAGLRRDFGGAYLRTAAYAGFRPPTLNELHRGFRVGDDITNANPALVPEKLYGAEIGAGAETDALRWDATLYYNRLDDPVTNVTIGTSQPGGALRQRRNAGAIEAVGVEGSVETSALDGRLWLRLAGTLVDSEVSGAGPLDGLRPAQTPAAAVSLSAEWRASARLTFAADGRWESKRYEDDLNTRELDAGGTLNARAGYALSDAVTLYALAENVFDAKIETAVEADGLTEYAAPRRLWIGLKLKR